MNSQRKPGKFLTQYYLGSNEDKKGPVTRSDIEEGLKHGLLETNSMVKRHGFDSWLRAEQWPEFYDAIHAVNNKKDMCFSCTSELGLTSKRFFSVLEAEKIETSDYRLKRYDLETIGQYKVSMCSQCRKSVSRNSKWILSWFTKGSVGFFLFLFPIPLICASEGALGAGILLWLAIALGLGCISAILKALIIATNGLNIKEMWTDFFVSEGGNLAIGKTKLKNVDEFDAFFRKLS